MEASDVWVALWQARRHVPGRAGGAILQHPAGNGHEGDGLDAVPRRLVRPQEAWAVACYQEVLKSKCKDLQYEVNLGSTFENVYRSRRREHHCS